MPESGVWPEGPVRPRPEAGLRRVPSASGFRLPLLRGRGVPGVVLGLGPARRGAAQTSSGRGSAGRGCSGSSAAGSRSHRLVVRV